MTDETQVKGTCFCQKCQDIVREVNLAIELGLFPVVAKTEGLNPPHTWTTLRILTKQEMKETYG